MKNKTGNKIAPGTIRLLIFSCAALLLVVLPLASRAAPPLLTPRSLSNAAQAGFADRAFQPIWERTDAPVLSGKVKRSWYWGPVAGVTKSEPYLESKTGTRLVQYFDKARMEINNPDGDRNSEWFVTTGLLVVDMVSGKQQVGDKDFVPQRAAEIAVGGDGLGADPDAPTYTSFRPVASIIVPGANRAVKLTGQSATSTINRAGQVGVNSALGLFSGAKFAAYSDATGHNIPQAMWDFLNLKGPVQQNGTILEKETIANWVFVMGYPITEPYWARIKVEGIYYDALFQLFERRSLVYLPSFPAGWQVQMGNVGAHYQRWLYGGPLPAPQVPTAIPAATQAVPTFTAKVPTAVATATSVRSATPLLTATKTATRIPTAPRGSATPVPTYPPVPTEPPSGLLLAVRPGFGPPDGQFTFSASGLAPNEAVLVAFTDPNGATVYPIGSNNGRYTADANGRLNLVLVPSQDFPAAPLGNWLFSVHGSQSGGEGVIGFTLR